MNRLEDILQSKCYQWFHNDAYPEQRGRLYMNYNNPPSVAAGSVLKGMGLNKGVSDLTYLMPNGKVIFIELKTEEKGSKQSEEQEKWQALVESLGFSYYLVRNETQFKQLINTLNNDERP